MKITLISDGIKVVFSHPPGLTVHANIIPAEQYEIIQSSISAMILDLNQAKSMSADMPDTEPIEATYTGRHERPKIVIDPDILGAPTELGQLFGVSSRSV